MSEPTKAEEKQKALKKNSKKFNKFIHSFTAHGVIHIFTGKSVIRRIIWLLIFLAASSSCLYDISVHIKRLVSKPTSTTTMITKARLLQFPAVTVCDLNHYNATRLEDKNLTNLVQLMYSAKEIAHTIENCSIVLHADGHPVPFNLSSIGYEELTIDAGHNMRNFICKCRFAGEDCDTSHMFKPVMTNLGLCYTFNHAEMAGGPLMVNGRGQKQGLQIHLRVDPRNHVGADSPGVKVAIHPQSELPLPDDQGYAVPVGMNAFIGIKETHIVDKTLQDCNTDDYSKKFNFLADKYKYSSASCSVDCVLTDIARDCGCIPSRTFFPPKDGELSTLPNCTIENLCCIYDKEFYHVPSTCHCLPSCSYVTYDEDISLSYSRLGQHPENCDATASLLSVNVYFKTFNVDTKTTSGSYMFVELLSDIGGQLGLFLGVSVITVIEFGAWILDEVKDRVFGMNERKIKKVCRKCFSWKKVKVADKSMEDTNLSYLLDKV